MPPTTELHASSPAIPVTGSLLHHFPTSVELPFGPLTGSSISCPAMKVIALRFTETAGSRIAKTGGECLTFDHLALRAPLGQYTDFNVDGLEKFIEGNSVPLVTTFNDEPKNHPFLTKFFSSPKAKAMLFKNFSNEYVDSFKSKYREVVVSFRGNDLIFLIGDVDVSLAAFQYFGLKEDQATLIIIQEQDAKKYLKEKLEPEQIATWVNEYMEGSLTVFRKSEPIPEVNDEPVKVVVVDSLHDVVINSKKNG